MTFERGLWAETAHNAKANLWVILFVVGALLAWTVFQAVTGNDSGIVSTIIWLVVIIAVHSTILRGQAGFAALRVRFESHVDRAIRRTSMMTEAA